jgi:predicted YcjX-like family ATPase
MINSETKEIFENMLKEMLNKKPDEKLIESERKKIEDSILENKKQFISMTTPVIYRESWINQIDKRILESKKVFIWLTGCTGSGKTFSIQALRNYEIIKKSNLYFNIVMENEMDYNYTKFSQVNAVDNITCESSKLKYLNSLYFDIIDYCCKNKKRLYFTSTKDFQSWINAMAEFSNENARAISSRFSNNIDLIDLGKFDKRKNN